MKLITTNSLRCGINEALWQLGVEDAARRIATGELTSRALVDSCLAHIAEHEPRVHAWRHLDVEAALAQAEACDGAERPAGSLHGVPIGIKDLIDTADMPTGYGSPIYDGNRPNADATCVARLRAAGAVILGKTVTTEFATFKPPVTRNPHNVERTPGGSSSGSAVAVALSMVGATLGSQTAGSVIRPAAFCGTVGFKPSFGAINLDGVKPLSRDLDTLGTFARSVADAALVARTIADAHGALGQTPTGFLPPPTVALCRTPDWDKVESSTTALLEELVARLSAAGAPAGEVVMEGAFAELAEAQNIIMKAQAAVMLRREHSSDRDQLSPGLAKMLDEGANMPLESLDAAMGIFTRCHIEAHHLFGDYDLLLTPAAPGEAPSQDSTGDPMFNRAWTALHVPCLTLPAGNGPTGMPLGVQLVARGGDDGRLIAWARWIEEILRG